MFCIVKLQTKRIILKIDIVLRFIQTRIEVGFCFVFDTDGKDAGNDDYDGTLVILVVVIPMNVFDSRCKTILLRS